MKTSTDSERKLTVRRHVKASVLLWEMKVTEVTAGEMRSVERKHKRQRGREDIGKCSFGNKKMKASDTCG